MTDYVSCMSWFAATASRSHGAPHTSSIEIECKNDGKGDMTDVFLSRSTSSVLAE